MTTRVRRALGALTAAVALTAGLIAAAPASSAAVQSTATMTTIRTGQHPGYDRIVLDMSGPAPSVSHQLTDELIADGSGEVVWLTGEYFISVVATPAQAHDAAGRPTYTGPQKFRTRNLRNVMAVAVTGDFEGHLSIGLGVRYRSAVHVYALTSPTRVVIDVTS